MIIYTNKTKIPISLAVWLAHDDYVYSDDPDTISATTMLKPIKAIVLARQNKTLQKTGDISSRIPSRTGTALHDSIEKSWTSKTLSKILESLGHNKSLVDKIVVNPNEIQLRQDIIPVYTEYRTTRELQEFKITGEFDFVAEGILEDFKSTSVFTVIFGSKNDDYIMQGSIYRWLNPKLITEDYMFVRLIFTDWSASKARYEKGYPPSRFMSLKLPLKSYAETELFLRNILLQVAELATSPQKDLPECDSKQLWQKDHVWKYYKNASKMTKATKNFDNAQEAYKRHSDDSGKGIIKYIPGEVIACRYCNVVDICDQAQQYIANKILIL